MGSVIFCDWLQGSSMLYHVWTHHTFWLLDSIPSYGHLIFLFIGWRASGLFPLFSRDEWCCSEHLYTWFYIKIYVQFLESPLACKEIQPVRSKGDQPWVFFGRTDAKVETTVLWPPHVKSWLIGKDWCWEGLGAGGEGDYRGWDGCMASPTQWTWLWVNSGSWWWTGRPGVLRFMGSQRVGHDWATELD